MNAAALLGVTLNPSGADVGVFSANASAVHFCLYDESGEREVTRTLLTASGAGMHSGLVSGVRAGARYGFRVDGPFDPAQGHRFDVSKLLADPYAAAIDRPYRLHPSLFEKGADSGPFVPKCIVVAPRQGEAGRQRIPWDRTVLYELNLRGFTKLRDDIPEAVRGRFAALAEAPIIAHLKSLGAVSYTHLTLPTNREV